MLEKATRNSLWKEIFTDIFQNSPSERQALRKNDVGLSAFYAPALGKFISWILALQSDSMRTRGQSKTSEEQNGYLKIKK